MKGIWNMEYWMQSSFYYRQTARRTGWSRNRQTDRQANWLTDIIFPCCCCKARHVWLDFSIPRKGFHFVQAAREKERERGKGAYFIMIWSSMSEKKRIAVALRKKKIYLLLALLWLLLPVTRGHYYISCKFGFLNIYSNIHSTTFTIGTNEVYIMHVFSVY